MLSFQLALGSIIIILFSFSFFRYSIVSLHTQYANHRAFCAFTYFLERIRRDEVFDTPPSFVPSHSHLVRLVGPRCSFGHNLLAAYRTSI